MKWLLILWGIVAGFIGIVLFAVSKSAVHEIEAALGFLIATVAIGCAGIIEAVEKAQDKKVPAEKGASGSYTGDGTESREIVRESVDVGKLSYGNLFGLALVAFFLLGIPWMLWKG